MTKPLRWHRAYNMSGDRIYAADGDQYKIENHHVDDRAYDGGYVSDFWIPSVRMPDGTWSPIDLCQRLAEAKAACQSDHEARQLKEVQP